MGKAAAGASERAWPLRFQCAGLCVLAPPLNACFLLRYNRPVTSTMTFSLSALPEGTHGSDTMADIMLVLVIPNCFDSLAY